MKTQLFHLMKYYLRGHWRLHKVFFLSNFFLGIFFVWIIILPKLYMNVNIMETYNFYLKGHWRSYIHGHFYSIILQVYLSYKPILMKVCINANLWWRKSFIKWGMTSNATFKFRDFFTFRPSALITTLTYILMINFSLWFRFCRWDDNLVWNIIQNFKIIISENGICILYFMYNLYLKNKQFIFLIFQSCFVTPIDYIFLIIIRSTHLAIV